MDIKQMVQDMWTADQQERKRRINAFLEEHPEVPRFVVDTYWSNYGKSRRHKNVNRAFVKHAYGVKKY